MHRLYYFRAKTDDIDALLSAFSAWADTYCDENNWYTTLLAVNSKSEVRVLNEHGARFWGLLGRVKSVDDAKELAWVSVRRWIATKYAALKEAPFREVEERLEENFTEAAVEILRDVYAGLAPSEAVSNPLNCYMRRKLVEVVERALESIAASVCPPFTDDGTPYDYPAYMLYHYADDEDGEAILIVDIHT